MTVEESNNMKAWIVTDEYDEYATVVFAETRNKARLEALATDCCECMHYCDIQPRRFKEADTMYREKGKMEWDDPHDRRFLVDHGWSCVEPEYEECPECPASDICKKYLDYKKEVEAEEETE